MTTAQRRKCPAAGNSPADAYYRNAVAHQSLGLRRSRYPRSPIIFLIGRAPSPATRPRATEAEIKSIHDFAARTNQHRRTPDSPPIYSIALLHSTGTRANEHEQLKVARSQLHSKTEPPKAQAAHRRQIRPRRSTNPSFRSYRKEVKHPSRGLRRSRHPGSSNIDSIGRAQTAAGRPRIAEAETSKRIRLLAQKTHAHTVRTTRAVWRFPSGILYCKRCGRFIPLGD